MLPVKPLLAFVLFIFSLFSSTLLAQNKSYTVGDQVDVNYNGTTYSGRIIKVNGERYRIRYNGFDSSNDDWVKAPQISNDSKLPKGVSKITAGKYVCSSSDYNQSTGMYEYTNRGSLIIYPNGKYEYLGYKEPSNGSYQEMQAGVLKFKGGYVDGGEATPITRPNKFFLVFPNIIGHRWTCEPSKK